MVVVKHIDSMLDYSLACNLEELLGSSKSRTGTYSSCQNHCYILRTHILYFYTKVQLIWDLTLRESKCTGQELFWE